MTDIAGQPAHFNWFRLHWRRGKLPCAKTANISDAYFADMVSYMSKLVGLLVDRLDELGLRDNTLVIFVGDNGIGVTNPPARKISCHRAGRICHLRLP